MGDVGDHWRDVREYYRERGISRRRHKRPAQKVRFKKTHERLGFRQCSEWHWQARIAGDLLDYWPSKSKWRWRGETVTGAFADLEQFIKSKTAEGA